MYFLVIIYVSQRTLDANSIYFLYNQVSDNKITNMMLNIIVINFLNSCSVAFMRLKCHFAFLSKYFIHILKVTVQ